MKKRKWIYIQKPQSYGISCDICGGSNFDRIELKTGQRLYMHRQGTKLIYCHKKPKPENDPQYIEGE